MKFVSTLYITLVSATLALTANAAAINGTVLDAAGDPIAGATAYLLVSGTHEHTDELGRFHFDDAPLGDTIAIQALGFATRREAITAELAIVSFQLKPLAVDISLVTIRPGLDAAVEVARADLVSRPAQSSQELLRAVPGLVIGQHAGGGKAEQLFLRGFDIDHGTDIAISVDGIPVNMVSHAHGQGYADLHWLIPETVERVDYQKGPYDASAGNFATAASVEFVTKRRLDRSRAQIEAGAFGYRRGLAMASFLDNEKADGYAALEWLQNDGPFESPQDLRRLNAFAKTNLQLANQTQLTLTGSQFTSRWDASGQVPQRSIDDGSITRFGAIDDTEGGNTSRTNLQAKLVKAVGTQGILKASVYGSRYDFELFSNFTFFLEDPTNGDQIRQREQRYLAGGEVSYANHLHLFDQDFNVIVGVGSRNDATQDSELSRTLNRTTTLERLQLGDVAEYNQYAYTEASWQRNKLGVTVGGRLDHTTFRYTDQLEGDQRLIENATTVNPKVRVNYTLNSRLQVFAKAGSGYHANDARLVTGNNTRTFMPKAYGSDLGATWKPIDKLVLTGALWGLWSAQEFVYVGDAGIVEPSGRSRRLGIDFSARANLGHSLYAGGDINTAYARSVDEAAGEDRIPLAPPLTTSAFVVLERASGWVGSVRFRSIADRPANEDYSITAGGYQLLDLTAGYRWNHFAVEAILDNALNQSWNETQFATESRLQNEAEPVEEIHFTPGAPRNLRMQLIYRF